MDVMKVVPTWVVVTLVLFIAALLGYVVATGREVSFWPPAISAEDGDTNRVLALRQSNAALMAEVDALKSSLAERAADIYDLFVTMH